MELNKTPITYQEASELLGVSLETVKKAVLRGVLTKLPREGLYQHIMEGQVMLFRDRMLSLSILNESERKLWQAYADSVKQRTVLGRSNVQAINSETTSPAESRVVQGSNFAKPLDITEMVTRGHPVNYAAKNLPDFADTYPTWTGTTIAMSEAKNLPDFADTYPTTPFRSDYGRYSEVALASALAAGIAAFAVSGNSPKTSEGLLFLALALLGVGGLLWILDEQDKQKREQAIDQAVKPIANPGDRFTVKTLLEDDALIERLRTIHATASLE